jgi:hypothetical protein
LIAQELRERDRVQMFDCTGAIDLIPYKTSNGLSDLILYKNSHLFRYISS